MFEALGERLAAALKKITGRGVLRPEDVEAGLREVRLALLEADVNFKVVKEFVERVRARLAGAEISPGLTAPQTVVKAGEAFGRAIGLDGVILTKLDGDARGGAALSLRVATGERIRFAGTGEKPQDLEVFLAERMASRILGMGDVMSLIEKAERSID